MQSTFVIPSHIEDPILTRDYSTLTKKEVNRFLTEHFRSDHLAGVKEVIYKEVWPEHKIINELPWK